jgi:hypothetical protein
MQRIACCGFGIVLTVLGGAGCADTLAPPERSSRPLPTFDVTTGGDVCAPCPPGVICAALCDPLPIDIVVPTKPR